MTQTTNPPTKGAAALRLATQVQRPKHPIGEVAEALGVDRETVRRWRSGESVPNAEHMAKLEDLLGIPMRAWVQDDSSPTIADADVDED